MSKLSTEIAAYESIQKELETDYPGMWVVIHNEKQVGLYESFEEAANDAVQQFGRGPYLIRKIGQGPISLPASVLYNPAFKYVAS